MTTLEIVKHLLRGRFVQVSRYRKSKPAEFRSLPEVIRSTADRFLGQGTGDAQGRKDLGKWMQENVSSIT